MLIFVHVDNETASESHRNPEESVEVEINDTIETVKIKISLIYTTLDPEKFTL
jgi:hypothetical protein